MIRALLPSELHRTAIERLGTFSGMLNIFQLPGKSFSLIGVGIIELASEKVMGFCTDEEYGEFMKTAPMFEQLLVHCGFTIIKYYLDITHEEQERRLKKRLKDPLTQWKLSPIDAKALKHWDDYSEARNAMLSHTHNVFAPWIVVKADDKRATRLNVIRDLLSRCDVHGKKRHNELPDPASVFQFDDSLLKNGSIAQ